MIGAWCDDDPSMETTPRHEILSQAIRRMRRILLSGQCQATETRLPERQYDHMMVVRPWLSKCHKEEEK